MHIHTYSSTHHCLYLRWLIPVMSSDVKRCLLSLSRGQTIDKGLCFHYLQELNKQYQYNTQKVEFQFEQCKKTGLLQSNFIQSENLKTGGNK